LNIKDQIAELVRRCEDEKLLRFILLLLKLNE